MNYYNQGDNKDKIDVFIVRAKLKNKDKDKTSKEKGEIEEQIQFCLGHPFAPKCKVPEQQSEEQTAYTGYSNPDLDALYAYWERILVPFNDILSADDIYRITSKGGWRASRNAFNLGFLEAIAQGGRQVYRDSWYQTLTPTQRLLRPIVAGAEALATDGISGLVGNGYAVAGFTVGGPPGAFAGKLAGATYATHVMDRFWTEKFNPNVLNLLGAWP
jgi:hypothetical protein